MLRRFFVSPILFLLFLLVSRPSFAIELFFRPHAGLGYATQYGAGGDGWGYHAGGRLQMRVDPMRSFGLDLTFLDLYALNPSQTQDRYLSIGGLERQAAPLRHPALGMDFCPRDSLRKQSERRLYFSVDVIEYCVPRIGGGEDEAGVEGGAFRR